LQDASLDFARFLTGEVAAVTDPRSYFDKRATKGIILKKRLPVRFVG
jgi:hypothetical protein